MGIVWNHWCLCISPVLFDHIILFLIPFVLLRLRFDANSSLFILLCCVFLFDLFFFFFFFLDPPDSPLLSSIRMLLTSGIHWLTAVWLVILFLWHDGAVGFPSGNDSEEVRISSTVSFYLEGGESHSYVRVSCRRLSLPTRDRSLPVRHPHKMKKCKLKSSDSQTLFVLRPSESVF